MLAAERTPTSTFQIEPVGVSSRTCNNAQQEGTENIDATSIGATTRKVTVTSFVANPWSEKNVTKANSPEVVASGQERTFNGQHFQV